MNTERRSYDSDIAEIKTIIKANTKTLDGIHTTIHGNGSDGMKTVQGKQGTHIKIQWWWLGTVSAFVLGIAGCIIKKAFL